MAEFVKAQGQGAINIDELSERLKETSNPIMVQYFKNLEKRTLLMTDFIDDSATEMYVMPLLEWDNDGSNAPIKIYLSSGGGSVYNGLTICDVISKLKCPTEVIVLSYAFSMGAMILMAGASNPNVTRMCNKFSVGLIHGGSTMIDGTTGAVKDYFNFNEKYEEKIKSFVLTNTKISETEYAINDRKEWYMDSDDMLKYGLVDKIV